MGNIQDKLKAQGAISFGELKDKLYGKRGEEQREAHELDATVFLLGALIQKERKNKKMTQEQLAEKLGVSKTRISQIENGADMSIKLFLKVIMVLDLSAKIVVGDDFELPLS
ncbi:helix-turn-helix transcriptional regulator [Persicobacter psychrovividus]|uniref:HTH cro/C1-type domain-containing protein n=1 Tax=Persicobacter psychrovividus TaxID=387638 RepID=A0ABN6LKJ3_9BACT|nr:hypothetical protein PEPS_47790 [Persicobacter psychrovividus]